MLKILGGYIKGLKIKSPPEDITRPMAIRAKRSLFDSFEDFTDVIFWDMCAGSGQIGVEVLSRNGKSVYFTEKSKTVYKILEKNIELAKAHLEKQNIPLPKVVKSNKSYQNYLSIFKSIYSSFEEEDKLYTILFFAPPYLEHQLYQDLFEDLAWYKGHLWVETDEVKGPGPEKIESHLKKKAYKTIIQGNTNILLFKFSNS